MIHSFRSYVIMEVVLKLRFGVGICGDSLVAVVASGAIGWFSNFSIKEPFVFDEILAGGFGTTCGIPIFSKFIITFHTLSIPTNCHLIFFVFSTLKTF